MVRGRGIRLAQTLTIALLLMLLIPSGLALARGVHVLAAGSALTSAANSVAEVDPFTGTGAQPGSPSGYAGGDTFPGADVPFGLVQWSPDTVSYAPGGYWYPDNRIKGFSLTHLNGAGCPAYGDIPFIPYVGTVKESPAANPSRYIATFSHAHETASPGYYQVALDNKVNVELTVTQHSGLGRFTYPQGQTATLLLNVSGSANGTHDAQVKIGHDSISGWALSGGFCGAKNTYKLYFWTQFSQPFATTGTWHDKALQPGNLNAEGGSPASPAVQQLSTLLKQRTSLPPSATQLHPATIASGPGSGAYVTFDTRASSTITAHVGVSFVSVANARDNVEQEAGHNNFARAQKQAQQAWLQRLNSIRIKGGLATQRSTFYTALYHVFLQPNIFSDVNGQYIGFDGNIHTVEPGHAQYANYSGWDIYRSEIQLLALLAPKETSDIVKSMLNDYRQSGQLPKWSLANSETYVMVGDPADPIIAGAYAFGARNFDTQAALDAMVKQATQPNNVRPGQNYLDELGYLPTDGHYGCCSFYGPAATSLEYNTADFAISAFARQLGEHASAQKFLARAQNWKKLFNPATHFLEPRNLEGAFPASYDPASPQGWVEGNGAQYSWMVPFNLRGLFNALGGNDKVVKRLDTFFTRLNAGPNQPYAFLGNEPTFETPWEYDYAGAPYKAQKVVRDVANTLYTPGPGGLAGNDDLGETSSWYVFAALGMFPETPGTADLALASPLFPEITIYRQGGQVIQIYALQASARTPYIHNLLLNGELSHKPWLPASFIEKGGTLNFTLSDTPDRSWGSDPADAPPSAF